MQTHHRNDLHERGPPITEEQRKLFSDVGRDAVIVGGISIGAITYSLFHLEKFTKVTTCLHSFGEVAGATSIGVGAMLLLAAKSGSQEVCDSTCKTIKMALRGVAAGAFIAAGVASTAQIRESNHEQSYALAHSDKAKGMRTVDADTARADNPSRPYRDFCKAGDDKIVVQGIVVKGCDRPAPKGYERPTLPFAFSD
ncbi:MAG: hypothetical protein DI551_11855 [Micavibrio aeruginosavorus]|uniref:Uncharacterized protein n=1 Tax=Micavibrio aeruginosavorus TaxID=349221 RepID=A0A2W5MTS8_9BACT|nr:MAG: hypothetical protein DI551_11855 [Micavibrio aeruginosavorus]